MSWINNNFFFIRAYACNYGFYKPNDLLNIRGIVVLVKAVVNLASQMREEMNNFFLPL